MNKAESIEQKINRLLSMNFQRRQFLAGVAGTAALSILPFSGCTTTSDKQEKNRFSAKQKPVLIVIQDHLFPREEHAPGARDILAANYLESAINQPGFDPEITDFIFSGLDQTIEYTEDKFDKSFIQLNATDREKVLLSIQEESWGSGWISLILSYIFEALLSDPIYGGNPNQIGWQWLEHTPGIPRPDERTRYAPQTKG